MSRPLVPVLAFVLLAAACAGSDGGGGSSDGGRLTEEDGTTSSEVESEASSATGVVGDPEAGRSESGPPTTDGPSGVDELDRVSVIGGGTFGVPYNAMPARFEGVMAETEFRVEGQAVAWTPEGQLRTDGQWAAVAGATAPYATRIVVRRPADAGAFSGVVLVEWLNVSAGRDSDPDYGFLADLIAEAGHAYVAVSAQAVGISGGGAVLPVPGVPPEALTPLQVWDPERYAELSHPGDVHSYGIFDDIGVLLADSGSALLGGLEPTHLIAMGESQSAGRLATYVNAVQPMTGTFDGFLIHSRFGGAASLGEESGPAEGQLIRPDVGVPVFQFETETDVVNGFSSARQRDTDALVTWEVAGTAHADQATLDHGQESSASWFTGEAPDLAAECGMINDGPQTEVLQAAANHLVDWVVEGTLPPSMPSLELDADGNLIVDEVGNALGGVRSPAVDVAAARHSGITAAENVFCSLFGESEPFSADELLAVHGSGPDYVAAVAASADDAVARGVLLDRHIAELVAEAEARVADLG